MSEAAVPQSLAASTGNSPRENRAWRQNRAALSRACRAGELGIVAYITAGDPSLAASERIVLAAAEAGADVIELGVPFSDPVADGPTIQRASERALRSGTTLAGVLDLVTAPARAHGSAAGAFQLLQSDSADGHREICGRSGRSGSRRRARHRFDAGRIRRISRDASERRASTRFFWRRRPRPMRGSRRLPRCSTGFLYLISRTGVTGARDSLPDELPALVRRARKFTAVADRGGIWNFAAGACDGARRDCGRGGGGFGAGGRGGKSGVAGCRSGRPWRTGSTVEERGARGRQPPEQGID